MLNEYGVSSKIVESRIICVGILLISRYITLYTYKSLLGQNLMICTFFAHTFHCIDKIFFLYIIKYAFTCFYYYLST